MGCVNSSNSNTDCKNDDEILKKLQILVDAPLNKKESPLTYPEEYKAYLIFKENMDEIPTHLRPFTSEEHKIKFNENVNKKWRYEETRKFNSDIKELINKYYYDVLSNKSVRTDLKKQKQKLKNSIFYSTKNKINPNPDEDPCDLPKLTNIAEHLTTAINKLMLATNECNMRKIEKITEHLLTISVITQRCSPDNLKYLNQAFYKNLNKESQKKFVSEFELVYDLRYLNTPPVYAVGGTLHKYPRISTLLKNKKLNDKQKNEYFYKFLIKILKKKATYEIKVCNEHIKTCKSQFKNILKVSKKKDTIKIERNYIKIISNLKLKIEKLKKQNKKI